MPVFVNHDFPFNFRASTHEWLVCASATKEAPTSSATSGPVSSRPDSTVQSPGKRHSTSTRFRPLTASLHPQVITFYTFCQGRANSLKLLRKIKALIYQPT